MRKSDSDEIEGIEGRSSECPVLGKKDCLFTCKIGSAVSFVNRILLIPNCKAGVAVGGEIYLAKLLEHRSSGVGSVCGVGTKELTSLRPSPPPPSPSS